MLEKQGSNRVSFLAPRTSSFNSRPLSEATEIVDTDFEADLSDLENSSNSGNSVRVAFAMTTAQNANFQAVWK